MAKKKKKKRPSPVTLGLPLGGVDSHAHLDMPDFASGLATIGIEGGLDEALAQAYESGISAIGNVFLGPDAYEKSHALFDNLPDNRPEIYFILGIHPSDAAKALRSDDPAADHIERMRAQFQTDPRIKGVGETGLDYYWDHSPHDVQRDLFRAHLALTRDLRQAGAPNLPVVIHCRDKNGENAATSDTLRILDEEGFRDTPVVWHCFGQGTALAQNILDRGWHLSIPGVATYRKNETLREAVAMVPLERILIETDCPYLAPEPWRGKTNHPALAAFTASTIAEIKEITPEEAWLVTGENARRVFDLPPLATSAG